MQKTWTAFFFFFFSSTVRSMHPWQLNLILYFVWVVRSKKEGNDVFYDVTFFGFKSQFKWPYDINLSLLQVNVLISIIISTIRFKVQAALFNFLSILLLQHEQIWRTNTTKGLLNYKSLFVCFLFFYGKEVNNIFIENLLGNSHVRLSLVGLVG